MSALVPNMCKLSGRVVASVTSASRTVFWLTLLLRRQPAAADDRQGSASSSGTRGAGWRGRRSSPTSRRRSYFEDLRAVLDELVGGGLDLKVVFLEADEEALLHRYKETRRRHPLAASGRIVDGIREERDLLAPLRERADVVIDTTS